MSTDPGSNLLLPDGSCLLHIGPPKTGTTSLQAAFWEARVDALAQGVRYAGRSRHEARGAYAVAHSVAGRPDAREIDGWERLVDQVHRAREPRVVVSSEHLSYAQQAAISRIVSDLGSRRVHVVVTLRPLARILPSRWQEYAKNGLMAPYGHWLEAMLGDPADARITPEFWLQQRHDELVARWVAVVGAGNLTVVVVEDNDHGGLLRTFERLTGLRDGTLAPVSDLANRSLTAVEVEAIRAVNARLRVEGFGVRDIDRMVRGGAARHLLTRRPAPDEPRIETPRWALDQAGEIAREMATGIRTSGVRVIGDLDILAVVPEAQAPAGDGVPRPGEPEADLALAREVGAQVAIGMYHAGRRDADPDAIRTRQLASALARRIPSSVARRLDGRRT